MEQISDDDELVVCHNCEIEVEPNDTITVTQYHMAAKHGNFCSGSRVTVDGFSGVSGHFVLSPRRGYDVWERTYWVQQVNSTTGRLIGRGTYAGRAVNLHDGRFVPFSPPSHAPDQCVWGTYEQVAVPYTYCDECATVCTLCGEGFANTDGYPGGGMCSDCGTVCAWCDDVVNSDSTTYVDNVGAVCDRSCLDHFTWCANCEEYRRNEDFCCGNGCTCESPATSFGVPNNGDGILSNDTRATIRLPSGVISKEGIQQIYTYLLRIAGGDNMPELAHLAYRITELGEKWQAKDGNFTKRLSRFAYKNFAIKVPPYVISEVGNIARAHSTEVDVEIEVTRHINGSPEEFVHEDSCWWGSYSYSRCSLKSNGGFGLRSFHGETDMPTGRAWVMPMKYVEEIGFSPTFESVSPDCYLVFNGYGDLEGYAAPRVMAHMAGMTYRKVGLEVCGMYVNSDSGYLIAPEEIADKYTDAHLSFTFDQHASLYDHERETANA